MKWAAVAVFCLVAGWFWSQDRALRQGLAQDEQSFAARLPVPLPAMPPGRVWSFRLHSHMGQVSIPRLGLSVPVVEGADERGLKMGAAHVLHTGYPGASANFVVAAHRDTLFRPLKEIRDGDQITFRSAGETFRYRVTGTEIIAPTNTEVLAAKDRPEMTLVTCYPFYYVGHAPQRFIVHAVEVPAADQQHAPQLLAKSQN